MTSRALLVRGLTKRFGERVALDGLNFDVEAGEVLGIVGGNGAGKTTTMRIILGVLAPDHGQVLWGGAPISSEARRRIGYMPEERGLYPRMKIHEQLLYFGRLHGMTRPTASASAHRWLERFGLSGRANEELQRLSHGNQQRVQLAAALVFEPELLILDEPFAGLDPEAIDSVSEVLRDLARKGLPVMFSSHQLDLVERLCDRVAIVRRGRLVAFGAVSQLRMQGRHRVWVEAPGAPAGWAEGLAGAARIRSEGTRVLFELSPSMDDQAILRAALETGPVREFRRDLPSLLDVFREAVAQDENALAS
jgi:ABC-2 type transport system ATP-binding protein